MKTNLEMLDKIVNLNNPKLLMICGKNDIEKIFNINLVSTIALEQQSPTAIFYNRKNENNPPEVPIKWNIIIT